MEYPPLIETMVQSLRTFAPGPAERESVEVTKRGDGYAVGMRCAGGIEVRVSAVAGTPSPAARHFTVQVLQSGIVVSEADGIPASGVGRVAQALHECLLEESLQVAPDEVIATFAEKVRAHQAPGLDTVRSVAEDPHGEVWLEVVDHAYRLGYDLEGRDGDGRKMLWQAFRDYQNRLRAELGVAPAR